MPVPVSEKDGAVKSGSVLQRLEVGSRLPQRMEMVFVGGDRFSSFELLGVNVSTEV